MGILKSYPGDLIIQQECILLLTIVSVQGIDKIIINRAVSTLVESTFSYKR
jgi:hypothetical protein